ncbi:MAG: hypothetical protein ACE5G9_13985 [Nitrospinales bacterium]
MVTQEQMAGHIKKAKDKLAKATEKAEDPKKDTNIRALRKKVKRLVRKTAKMEYAKKKAAEKQKSKKEQKEAS